LHIISALPTKKVFIFLKFGLYIDRRILSSVSLAISLIVLSLPNFNFTGAVIAEISYGQNLIYILSLIFFIASVFLFLSKKSLDAIIIPTGTLEADIDRTNKALSEKYKLKNDGYFLISGYKGEGLNQMRKGQPYRIYKHLRDNGVLPKDIRIEGKSHNTMENVLYTLKKMKEMEEKIGKKKPLDIAFVSSLDHLKRFNDFYQKAIEIGLINKKDFRFHKIEAVGAGEEPGYEDSFSRKILHNYKLRRMGRYRTKKGSIKYAKGEDFLVRLARKIKRRNDDER